VEDVPGVTRDRVYGECEWCGSRFSIIDTGGIELEAQDGMYPLMLKQAEAAVASADVIVFVTDAKFGLTSSDYDVADFLRKCGKPVILCVNKTDGKNKAAIFDFYALNLGQIFDISAEQGSGVGDLLDEIVLNLKESVEKEDTDALKIAIVGKPNAGKSSILNKFAGFERVIVSPIAGTTRDAIDERITCDGKDYIITDTAGIRKKARVDENVEYYSVVRAFSAIKRSDAVAVILDAEEGLTDQDVKIAGFVHNDGKPSVIVVNKWDLIEKDTHTAEKFTNKLKEDLKFMDYFLVIYVSALTGKRLPLILKEAERAYKNAHKFIKTGILNDVIGDAIAVNEPPHKNGKKLKINFTRQVENLAPPTFDFFVNDPEIVHFSYKRFLENTLRKSFGFEGTPIRLRFKIAGENSDNKKK
jgi:GTP-binding protein